ncbi:MAG: type I glutamate--ammonia ligase [Coxiellaceae bacterium]|nr:type I glutamate--ammonia ligase [Coxiellaceae bacterium]
MASDFLKLMKETQARYVDLRFTDTRGKEQHVTIPSNLVDEDFLKKGKMFDGSSIDGWKGIQESDMILMPDQSTALLDPFYEDPTLILRCDVIEPQTMKGYERDPRSIAQRAEEYLKQTGIGDKFIVGPEPEFFLFDDVRFTSEMNCVSFCVDSDEGIWNSKTEYEGGNKAQRPGIKGGYFPVPPVDSSQDIRTTMCNVMADLGMIIEAHHHEVATGNQNEIAIECNTLLKKADNIQVMKYVVWNVARQFGKTATFMPKPLVGDNGNGMHVHQSISKDGVNLFAGDQYGGLSQLALHFIGGIIKHVHSLNAFTNASTNSYKRLTPGFEAPTMLAYSNRNRSVAIRIPYHLNPKTAHIEVRFPDASGNPYLSFSAMLMAGLDGIQNKIDPGEPTDKDLYDITPREAEHIPHVCTTLQQALEALHNDKEYLMRGGVFTEDFIDSYIKLKTEEVKNLRNTTHPVEYGMYFDL